MDKFEEIMMIITASLPIEVCVFDITSDETFGFSRFFPLEKI